MLLVDSLLLHRKLGAWHQSLIDKYNLFPEYCSVRYNSGQGCSCNDNMSREND